MGNKVHAEGMSLPPARCHPFGRRVTPLAIPCHVTQGGDTGDTTPSMNNAEATRRAPEARNVMTFPSLLDAVSLLSMKRSPRMEGSHPIYARNRRRAWQGGVTTCLRR